MDEDWNVTEGISPGFCFFDNTIAENSNYKFSPTYFSKSSVGGEFIPLDVKWSIQAPSLRISTQLNCCEQILATKQTGTNKQSVVM